MDQKTMDMYSQSNRLQTFSDWPFTENCLCTPIKMAEAGFYHCPTDREPDLVLCYVCGKELDGWGPEDDPWEEHLSHSSDCPFIKLGKKMAKMTLADFLRLETARCQIFMRTQMEAMKEDLTSKAAEARTKILKIK